ncbi:unnamed protein product [Rhizophagus irregularis]|nr:unnamed protein product [Rhizophagus irregularis]
MKKNQDSFRVDFQRSEEEEPRFVRSGMLPGSEEWKRIKIRSDELWINGEPRFVSTSSGGLQTNKGIKICLGGLQTNRRTKIRLGGFLSSEERKKNQDS